MDTAGLQAAAPGLDWAAFLAAYTGKVDGVAAQRLVVGQPRFAAVVAQMAQSEPLDAWRTYLRRRLLACAARPRIRGLNTKLESSGLGVRIPYPEHRPRRQPVVYGLPCPDSSSRV
jgi:hypothetical protein